MLGRLRCILAVLFLLCVVPTMVFAAGYALSGVGVKAYSMGGAFRGVADDYSAAYWNPAGLVQLKSSTVSAVMVGLDPVFSYTPKVPELGTENGLEIYAEDQIYLIPNFNAFMKFGEDKKYTAGIAVFVPYGLGTRWNEYNPPAGFGGKSDQFPAFDSESEIKIIDIHPTAAIKFNDLISAGVGLSIQRGAIKMRRTYFSKTGFPYSPYTELPLDMYVEEGTGWGIGGNFGLLLTPNEKLRIGLVGRSGTKLSLSGDANLDLYFPTTDDPTFQALAPQLFTGQMLSSTVDAEAELHTPADLGVGISYKVFDNLLLSFDLNKTFWRTAMDRVEIDFEGDGPTGQPMEDSELVTKWDDTIRISFGTEYQLNPMLALRAGYWYEETAIPNKTYRPTWADCGDKHSFTFGGGINFSPITFDIAYEYVMFDERTILTNTYEDDGTIINRGGDYMTTVHLITSAITYNF